MTQHLYYEDATLREFTAHVLERQEDERGLLVRLDRTAFYPTSGGQPHDVGTLNGIAVTDVWEDASGAVWHLLEPGQGQKQAHAPVRVGETVTGRIDWHRRFDHMQQHTGQHLLSAAFQDRWGAATVGFHLGEMESTIDLELPDLSWEAAHQVESLVNAVVWEDRPVDVISFAPEELAEVPLRKPPQVEGDVRVVFVRDYDATACGGTHVARTGEIGVIKITGLARYKGGVRVSFVCGGRALRDYQRIMRLAQEAAYSLSVGLDELPEAVERVQEEGRTTRRALSQAEAAMREWEAERLWAAAPVVEGVRRLVVSWPERDFSEVRTLASQLRASPRTLVLMAAGGEKGVRVVCARSDDLPAIHANEILQRVLQPLDGRGGGSPAMAQGGSPPHPAADVEQALQQAITALPTLEQE